MKLSLLVTDGVHAGQVIAVNGVCLLIGRGPSCHIRPNSPAVSQRHCALLVRGERAFVRDLDSQAGTFLNDRQIRGEIELRDGDFLQVGPLMFVVTLAAAGPAGALATTPPIGEIPAAETRSFAAETQEMPAFVPAPLPEEVGESALVGSVVEPVNGTNGANGKHPPMPKATWTRYPRRPPH